MPDDVDNWAERVAIIYANTPSHRRTAVDLAVIEKQLGAHYLNRSVDEARRIVGELYAVGDQ